MSSTDAGIVRRWRRRLRRALRGLKWARRRRRHPRGWRLELIRRARAVIRRHTRFTPREGLDYAFSRPSIAALKADGARFVCRYLSYDAGKNLTRGEARELSRAGIDIVVVWETTAQRPLAGYRAGRADALAAHRQARACGAPRDVAIYFAIDWDATPSQQQAIDAYFRGVASVIGRRRAGAYGGYWPVKRLLDRGLVRYAWQTYAWSGGRWDERAAIRQYQNDVTVGGAAVDRDLAMRRSFGQWRAR